MIVDRTRISEMFAVETPPPEEFLQAAFDFTMGFLYAEVKIFDRRANLRSTDRYADNLFENLREEFVNPDDIFKYFHARYVTGNSSQEKLRALSNFDSRVEKEILDALSIENPTPKNKTSAVFKVIIRLRHNLFHGNKSPAIIHEPQAQGELINKAVIFLSDWLKKLP